MTYPLRQSSSNIFDNLPDLAPTSNDLRDELDRYLATDTEDVKDGLLWWHKRRATFPGLSRMARVYLSIPGKGSYLHKCRHSTNLFFLATSVDVERVFSQGRLLLSHVRSRLTVQSTRALLCLGIWSEMDLIKDNDIKAGLGPEVACDEEEYLCEDWDAI